MKIKVVTRPRKDKQGKVPIYIRIADAGKSRYVSTGLKIKPKYWNKKGRVRKNDYCDADHLNKIIRDKVTSVRNEVYEMKANNEAVNADTIKKRTKSKETTGDYIEYAKKFAERKRRVNVQTGRRYDGIVSKLESYTGGRLPFKELTVTWLKEYMDWLSTERKNKANTIHSNMRAIRAILYAAIDEDLFPQERNPFFKLTLKQPKVSKTKLSAKEVKDFAKEETKSDFQELARDLFLFSFFTQGMRFRDVATIRNQNITDSHIVYEMNKTGTAQSVEIHSPARKIIKKYASADATPQDFVFPLIEVEKVLRNLIPVDEDLEVSDLSFDEAPTGKMQEIQKELDRDISSKNTYVNKEIKKVADRAGISKSISFHVARHSYADIGRSKSADLHELSKSLGHSSLKVTENYLSSLGNDATNGAAKTIYEEF
jgi:site-specific recombinase XerD